MENQNKLNKKNFKIPHAYVILFLIILLVSVLTYIISAGEFERYIDPESGVELVNPKTFNYLESNPISFFDMFQSIPQGMEYANQIIFFVLIIGGSFGIVQHTQAIDAGIHKLVKVLEGKEKIVIPIITLAFSLVGAILGFAEEILPFYPIIIALSLALGYDRITGTAMVLLGAGAGFASAFLNPFTVGIAHGIAGLPLFSGLAFRLVVYVVMLTATILYILHYAEKVRKDPKKSPHYNSDKEQPNDYTSDEELMEFTNRHKGVLLTFILGMAFILYGVIQLDFYIQELSASFLIIGVIAGLVGNVGINGIAESFVEGAKEMVYGALIIGIASAILVVMETSQILDTITNGLSLYLQNFTTIVSGIAMFFVQTLLNIFIPSGSGQAAVSMPIMAPLADLLGLTRQTSVLAFQFGDGITNVISPTSGYFMAALAISGIKWNEWVKWFWPLFLIWNAIAVFFVVVAVLINYGPF